MATVTMSALISASGPTSESTNETMSLFASSTCSAYFVSGESVLSVMATTVAPRSEAYFNAFTAFLEYRGKLMPMSASPSPMCTICCKICASLVALISCTESNTKEK